MSDILIQIVDENDQPVSSANMSAAHKQGLLHRIVRIVVEDSNGRILLQKRAADHRLYENCWDNSASGHVDEGESYETAAARELLEEIGVGGVELQEVGYYHTDRKINGLHLNRFNKVYKTTVAPDTTFVLQPEEVAGTQWFSLEEIRQLIHDHPDQITDGTVDVFERCY